ncbi:hypothetical protein [Fibrella forsythiae]|uniref:DUF4352 domain-containing protein n=1 Tax=Fibrella forsythiae TaxID=2817061 RepID=A0ABS3JB37_9BACT|nr:hypothetical protein [Fibrella forsythiae]MBO0947201.1 hypothetical protein [Fibrella forsythiae]
MNRIVYFSFRVLSVPVLAGLLSGCAPTQYIQLQPVSGPVSSVGGRLVTKADADSVEVVASYEREDMEYIALDVEIKNRTSAPLLIDPATFQVELLDRNRKPLNLQGDVSFAQAADPEYEAGRTEFRIRKEERRLKTAKILNTVLLVAVVASDITTSTSRSTNRDYSSWASNRISHDVAYNLIQAKRVIDRGVFADRMQRYQFEGYRWQELAMKRAQVKPGESVRGFVYLPKVKKAAFLNVRYPTASGTSIQLLFEQTLSKFKPRQ